MPIFWQLNLSLCGLGCHFQISHTGYLHLPPFTWFSWRNWWRNWSGMELVLKSINQELWVWPKGTKFKKIIYPSPATQRIRPTVHETASRISSIMYWTLTTDLIKQFQQYKLGCKIQNLNQDSAFAVFYAYDPLTNFH